MDNKSSGVSSSSRCTGMTPEESQLFVRLIKDHKLEENPMSNDRGHLWDNIIKEFKQSVPSYKSKSSNYFKERWGHLKRRARTAAARQSGQNERLNYTPEDLALYSAVSKAMNQDDDNLPMFDESSNDPEDLFLLEWKEFSSTFLSSISNLKNDNLFTDVTLLAEDQDKLRPFRAHKLILSAGSSYFRQTFESLSANSFSKDQQVIVLKSVPAADLSSILDFLYLGKVNVGQDRLDSFLKTANQLKIKGLSDEQEAGEKRKGFIGKRPNVEETLPSFRPEKKRKVEQVEKVEKTVNEQDIKEEEENFEQEMDPAQFLEENVDENVVIPTNPYLMEGLGEMSTINDTGPPDRIQVAPPRKELQVLFGESGRCHFCRVLCPDKESLKQHLENTHQPPRHALCENCENFFHICAINRHRAKCPDRYHSDRK